jgi:hypothetical protein
LAVRFSHFSKQVITTANKSATTVER